MLDPTSPIPLYYQLKTILLDQILQGKWLVGEFLPSENELAKEYQVSRQTVRRALAELQREGRISTHKGKGSLVAQPKLEQDLLRFYSLARSFSKGPHRVSSRILHRDRTSADPGAETIAYRGHSSSGGDQSLAIPRRRTHHARDFISTQLHVSRSRKRE